MRDACRHMSSTKVDSEIILSRGIIYEREREVERERKTDRNCVGPIKMIGRHLLCKQIFTIFLGIYKLSRVIADVEKMICE